MLPDPRGKSVEAFTAECDQWYASIIEGRNDALRYAGVSEERIEALCAEERDPDGLKIFGYPTVIKVFEEIALVQNALEQE